MQGQNQRSFENILLSATVVVAGKTVVFPIDRVKLLKQNEGEILISGRLVKPYTGYRDIVRRVYQTEGLRMFWRGNLINIIGYGNQNKILASSSESVSFKHANNAQFQNILRMGKSLCSPFILSIVYSNYL